MSDQNGNAERPAPEGDLPRADRGGDSPKAAEEGDTELDALLSGWGSAKGKQRQKSPKKRGSQVLNRVLEQGGKKQKGDEPPPWPRLVSPQSPSLGTADSDAQKKYCPYAYLRTSEPDLDLTTIPAFPESDEATQLPRIVVADFETTGFARTDHIIEIAAIELATRTASSEESTPSQSAEAGSTESQRSETPASLNPWECHFGRAFYRTGRCFHMRIQPQAPIHPKAQEVHGLSQQFLKENGEPLEFALNRFFEFLGEDSLMVTHNAAFDGRVLDASAERCGLDGLKILPRRRRLCTLRLYRALYPRRNASLDDAAFFFGEDRSARTNTHSAWADVELAVRVLLDLIKLSIPFQLALGRKSGSPTATEPHAEAPPDGRDSPASPPKSVWDYFLEKAAPAPTQLAEAMKELVAGRSEEAKKPEAVEQQN